MLMLIPMLTLIFNFKTFNGLVLTSIWDSGAEIEFANTNTPRPDQTIGFICTNLLQRQKTFRKKIEFCLCLRRAHIGGIKAETVSSVTANRGKNSSKSGIWLEIGAKSRGEKWNLTWAMQTRICPPSLSDLPLDIYPIDIIISHSSYVQKERFNSFVQRIYNIYALQLHTYVRIFDKSGPWVYSVPCLDPFHNLKCCKYVSCNILCLNSLTCENKLVSVQTLRWEFPAKEILWGFPKNISPLWFLVQTEKFCCDITIAELPPKTKLVGIKEILCGFTRRPQRVTQAMLLLTSVGNYQSKKGRQFWSLTRKRTNIWTIETKKEAIWIIETKRGKYLDDWHEKERLLGSLRSGQN